MKKVIFAIAAAALALVSCTKFEDEPVVTFETAAAPLVSVTVTGDNSISFVVTPGSNTGYYAYALFAGEVDASTINASALIAGKASGAMQSEVTNVAKKESIEGEVTKLSSNTSYTVAAVASSSGTQSLSKVSALTVTTTDGTAPVVVVDDYKYAVEGKEMTFAVIFDDPVTVTDTANFFVRVFAKHNPGPAPYYILNPVKQVAVPAENISQSGASTVTVAVPEEAYAPGAYVALYIGSGAVVNALGAVNAAFTQNLIIVEGNYTAATTGLLCRYKNVSFDLASPFADDEVYSAKDLSTLAVELTPDLFGTDNSLFAGKGDITVTTVTDGTGRKIEYALSNWEIDSATGTKVIVGLDENPAANTSVSFSVPAGFVEDYWGNTNKAVDITDQVYCSFYGVDALVGTWNYAGTSYFKDADEEDIWVFAESDDPTKGNVMLTTIFGFENDYKVYCNFDLKNLTVTIPDSVPFYNYVEYQLNDDQTDYVYDEETGEPVVADSGVLITGCDEADEVVFDFSEGELSNPSCWFGYYGISMVNDDYSGWWNIFKELTVTKSTPVPTLSATTFRQIKAVRPRVKKI